MTRAVSTDMPVVQSAVYSASQVARLLGISVATVYTLANNGDIPCKKVGRRRIFSRAAIHDWLNEPKPAPLKHG